MVVVTQRGFTPLKINISLKTFTDFVSTIPKLQFLVQISKLLPQTTSPDSTGFPRAFQPFLCAPEPLFCDQCVPFSLKRSCPISFTCLAPPRPSQRLFILSLPECLIVRMRGAVSFVLLLKAFSRSWVHSGKQIHPSPAPTYHPNSWVSWETAGFTSWHIYLLSHLIPGWSEWCCMLLSTSSVPNMSNGRTKMARRRVIIRPGWMSSTENYRAGRVKSGWPETFLRDYLFMLKSKQALVPCIQLMNYHKIYLLRCERSF